MGRYYPPDASNPPRFNTNSHPLGSRASKISSGILTVRFELPFSVWCNHCTPSTITGQGVRFNAEKKKVGAYYSTPIWSFRMKHSVCSGEWEIRTDPKNAAYVCYEGCRRREDGSEVAGGLDGGFEGGEGDMRFLSEEERKKRREDAFAGFEGKQEDKAQEDGNKKRLQELYAGAEKWRNPYDENAKLRRDFRGKRKVWQKEERETESVKEKYSLGMEIMGETEADRAKAGMVEFGAGTVRAGDEAIEDVIRRPLFDANPGKELAVSAPKEEPSSQRPTKKLKAELKAEKSRTALQQRLIGNSRAAIDPFLATSFSSSSSPFSTKGAIFTKPNLGILKRKRETTSIPSVSSGNSPEAIEKHYYAPSPSYADKPTTHIQTGAEFSSKNRTVGPILSKALVDYDSD